MTDPDASPSRASVDDDDQGPIGPFPSWKAVYWAVVIATLLMIVVLYVFTVSLDFSGR